MKDKIIRFWQEQQPNGLIAESSNRLVFIGGWIMVFMLIWFWEILNKDVDYYLLGVIITAITGTKLYSKKIENSALTNEAENKPEDPS